MVFRVLGDGPGGNKVHEEAVETPTPIYLTTLTWRLQRRPLPTLYYTLLPLLPLLHPTTPTTPTTPYHPYLTYYTLPPLPHLLHSTTATPYDTYYTLPHLPLLLHAPGARRGHGHAQLCEGGQGG